MKPEHEAQWRAHYEDEALLRKIDRENEQRRRRNNGLDLMLFKLRRSPLLIERVRQRVRYCDDRVIDLLDHHRWHIRQRRSGYRFKVADDG